MAGVKVICRRQEFKLGVDNSRSVYMTFGILSITLRVIYITFGAKGLSNIEASWLVTLAFAGSIGMTLVILGCALPEYKVWWTFFVVLFYILSPLPTLIARRYTESSGSSSTAAYELAIFITMGFVVSSFALPIVLARSPENEPVIKWGACYLTLAGNVVVYATLLGFFMTFDAEDTDYSMW